jgi:hypothetical protein
MIKLVVVVAFVELLFVIVWAYLPGFPISKELINTIVLAILALLGVDVVEFAAKKAVAKLHERGLWK